MNQFVKMFQIRYSVIVLFIIVTSDNIYSASVVTEKEIENAAQRELKIRDDIENSSLEARSRTERWVKFVNIETPPAGSVSINSSVITLMQQIFLSADRFAPIVKVVQIVNKEEIFKEMEPVDDCIICKNLNPKTELTNDDDDKYHTREKRYAKYETSFEDNDENDDDDDDDQENDGFDDGEIDEETEEEIVPYSGGHRRHHRHASTNHRLAKAHTPHKKKPGKSYVKLPTGVFVYIDKHEGLINKSKCGSKTILLKLKPKDYEYKLMANEMQSTIQSHTSLRFTKYIIKKIERVVSGCLLRKYKKRQEDIKSEYNHLNERILFHGTYKVKELLATGFDERYASIDGMFGAGVYFAKHSSKSNHYAFGHGGQCDKHGDRHCKICERKMLICRVTLGHIQKVTKAKRGIAHPPPGYHSLQGVATNANRGLKYNEYIIYRGEQAYPEYVITYKLKP